MFFNVSSLSRADGRSAPAAAAYRAGERLRDEGRGQVYNHSRRRDIEHREILLPASRAGAVPDWVQDRNRLWNAAEAAESRGNARVAREYLVALPHELSAAARVDLARRFAQELADRYGTVVDLAAHQPRAAGDPRNYHAHLLATTREITATGLGRKAAIELNDSTRRSLDMPRVADELRLLRANWSAHANTALREAGLDLRLDPRTLRAQGIDRLPQQHVPMAVIQMERRGVATEFMRAVRERAADLAVVPAPTRAIETPVALSIDARQAQARERWLAMREAPVASARGSERAYGLPGPNSNASREREAAAGLEWGD